MVEGWTGKQSRTSGHVSVLLLLIIPDGKYLPVLIWWCGPGLSWQSWTGTAGFALPLFFVCFVHQYITAHLQQCLRHSKWTIITYWTKEWLYTALLLRCYPRRKWGQRHGRKSSEWTESVVQLVLRSHLPQRHFAHYHLVYLPPKTLNKYQKFVEEAHKIHTDSL